MNTDDVKDAVPVLEDDDRTDDLAPDAADDEAERWESRLGIDGL